MQTLYFKVVGQSKNERRKRQQKENMRAEKALFAFLEELKSISIMNSGLSERKSKGRPEDRGMEDGWIEKMKI